MNQIAFTLNCWCRSNSECILLERDNPATFGDPAKVGVVAPFGDPAKVGVVADWSNRNAVVASAGTTGVASEIARLCGLLGVPVTTRGGSSVDVVSKTLGGWCRKGERTLMEGILAEEGLNLAVEEPTTSLTLPDTMDNLT